MQIKRLCQRCTTCALCRKSLYKHAQGTNNLANNCFPVSCLRQAWVHFDLPGTLLVCFLLSAVSLVALGRIKRHYPFAWQIKSRVLCCAGFAVCGRFTRIFHTRWNFRAPSSLADQLELSACTPIIQKPIFITESNYVKNKGGFKKEQKGWQNQTSWVLQATLWCIESIKNKRFITFRKIFAVISDRSRTRQL